MIWIYNINSKKWKKHTIGGVRPQPTFSASATIVGSDVYMFGGMMISHGDETLERSNELWKLSRTGNSTFSWSMVTIRSETNNASPRLDHSSWEWNNKLYVFGGFGCVADQWLQSKGDFKMLSTKEDGYNNQMLEFDPNRAPHQWEKKECLGTVPKHRAGSAVAKSSDRLWLCGGWNNNECFDDMFWPDMNSWQWTRVQPTSASPGFMRGHSLTMISPSHLVMHGSDMQSSNKCKTYSFDTSSYSWRNDAIETDVQGQHTAVNGNGNGIMIIGGRRGLGGDLRVFNYTVPAVTNWQQIPQGLSTPDPSLAVI